MPPLIPLYSVAHLMWSPGYGLLPGLSLLCPAFLSSSGFPFHSLTIEPSSQCLHPLLQVSQDPSFSVPLWGVWLSESLWLEGGDWEMVVTYLFPSPLLTLYDQWSRTYFLLIQQLVLHHWTSCFSFHDLAMHMRDLQAVFAFPMSLLSSVCISHGCASAHCHSNALSVNPMCM